MKKNIVKKNLFIQQQLVYLHHKSHIKHGLKHHRTDI